MRLSLVLWLLVLSGMAGPPAASLERSSGHTFFVGGNVLRPGLRAIPKGETILAVDTLIRAGWIPSEKDQADAFVLRWEDKGAPARVRIPLAGWKILGGEVPDVEVQPGDIIYAPEKRLAPNQLAISFPTMAAAPGNAPLAIAPVKGDKIYVIGAVHRPAAYAIGNGSSLTVGDGIMLARGLWASSDATQSFILRNRGAGAAPKRISVNALKILTKNAKDVELRAGDVLCIPQRKARRWLPTIPGPGIPNDWPTNASGE